MCISNTTIKIKLLENDFWRVLLHNLSGWVVYVLNKAALFFYSHLRRRLMYSVLPAAPDRRNNQSAGFLWLNSGKPLVSLSGWSPSPEKRIFPDSMASLSCTREAISKPHLFFGPSNCHVSVVSQSMPLCGRAEGAIGQTIALRQLLPKTSNKFYFQPKL